MKAARFLGLLLAGAAPAFAASPTSAVHDIVARHIAAGDISGAIVLAAKDGKVVTLEAQGNSSLKNGVPLRTDSVLWIASMTKPIVATATMMLVEQGKVKLDDPVSKYIPEFHDTKVRVLKPGFAYTATGRPDPKGPKPEYDVVPASRPLTVRDFLTFTSGLQTLGVPNETIPPIGPDDTLPTWVPKLGASTLDFQPGSRWAYSNATGFEVAARVVEVASGQPFAEFVRQHIFVPLDMKDTNFGTRADLASRTLPLGGLGQNPIMTGKFSSGSAGLLSTATDYSHFAQMLLNGGTYQGHRLLKPETVKAMSSNEIGSIGLAGIDPGDYSGLQTKVTPGIKYGFGLVVVNDPKPMGLSVPAGSFGWDGVGTRRWWAMPSKKTVLVMMVPEAAQGIGAAPTHREIEAAVVAMK